MHESKTALEATADESETSELQRSKPSPAAAAVHPAHLRRMSVGSATDPAEVEADAVADRIVGVLRSGGPQEPLNTERIQPGTMGGVFFIRLRSGVMHVVKATSDVGATLFAEHMVESQSGRNQHGGRNVESANSKPVLRGDLEHARIITAIESKRPPADPPEPRRVYDEKLEIFRGAPLVVQADLSGGRANIDIQDLQHETGVQADPATMPNGFAIQARVTNEIKHLTDAGKMERLGRLLASDTLVGNADRFEVMNTDNAFFGTDDIGAIDTEAVMQGYQGFKTYAASDYGAVYASADPASGYVSFLVNDGVKMEQRPTPPSPSLARLMPGMDLTDWFKKTFVAKYYNMSQSKPVSGALTSRGYPPAQSPDFDGSKWPAVLAHIQRGFDAGSDQISQTMLGQGLADLRSKFDEAETDADATGDDNFDFDALMIRGMYMAGVHAGKQPDAARHEAARWIAWKHDHQYPMPAKVTRVLAYAGQHGFLRRDDVDRFEYFRPSISDDDLNAMTHVRGKAGKMAANLGSKLRGNTDAADAEATRLEEIRSRLFRYFLLGGDTQPIGDLARAVRVTRSLADDIRAGGQRQSTAFARIGFVER